MQIFRAKYDFIVRVTRPGVRNTPVFSTVSPSLTSSQFSASIQRTFFRIFFIFLLISLLGHVDMFITPENLFKSKKTEFFSQFFFEYPWQGRVKVRPKNWPYWPDNCVPTYLFLFDCWWSGQNQKLLTSETSIIVIWFLARTHAHQHQKQKRKSYQNNTKTSKTSNNIKKQHMILHWKR